MPERCLEKTDVYFSVADGQVTVLAEEEGFTKALVHAALVDSRLVVPDVFFFNSPGLYQHTCLRSDKSLLETAMEAGLVIPALRTPASSFAEISTHLAEQRIVGLASEASAWGTGSPAGRSLQKFKQPLGRVA